MFLSGVRQGVGFVAAFEDLFQVGLQFGGIDFFVVGVEDAAEFVFGVFEGFGQRANVIE